MNAKGEREHGVEDGLDRMALDVEGLGVDWAHQRAMINERIESREARSRVWRSAWAGAAAAAVVAAVALIVWWRGSPVVGEPDMDQFFTEVDVISESYVPEGLYVLNGYLDDEPDAEAMVEFVVPQVGGEEEL